MVLLEPSACYKAMPVDFGFSYTRFHKGKNIKRRKGENPANNNSMLCELWDISFFKSLLYLASRYIVTYCTFDTVGLYFIHTFIVVSGAT